MRKRNPCRTKSRQSPPFPLSPTPSATSHRTYHIFYSLTSNHRMVRIILSTIIHPFFQLPTISPDGRPPATKEFRPFSKPKRRAQRLLPKPDNVRVCDLFRGVNLLLLLKLHKCLPPNRPCSKTEGCTNRSRKGS